MVLTVRVATDLATYVGSGTSTGSQASGSRAQAAASTTTGMPWVASLSSTSARQARSRAVDHRHLGALAADHQPAGDQPGGEDPDRDEGPREREHPARREDPDQRVRGQDEGDHAETTTGGPGGGQPT